MEPVHIAYIINIVILVPIGLSTVFRFFPTDEGRFPESPGWRIMAGSLWCGIAVLSVLGLFHPLRYSPVLLHQMIYKMIWLIVYAFPGIAKGEFDSIPRKMTVIFIGIVALWPFLIPWRYLF